MHLCPANDTSVHQSTSLCKPRDTSVQTRTPTHTHTHTKRHLCTYLCKITGCNAYSSSPYNCEILRMYMPCSLTHTCSHKCHRMSTLIIFVPGCVWACAQMPAYTYRTCAYRCADRDTHTHRITLLCMGLFFIIFRSIWFDIRYMYGTLWYQLKCQHDGPSIVQMWPACMVTPATNESPCCTPERGVMMCCINAFGWLRAKTSPSHINLYHLNSFDIYIYSLI